MDCNEHTMLNFYWVTFNCFQGSTHIYLNKKQIKRKNVFLNVKNIIDKSIHKNYKYTNKILLVFDLNILVCMYYN